MTNLVARTGLTEDINILGKHTAITEMAELLADIVIDGGRARCSIAMRAASANTGNSTFFLLDGIFPQTDHFKYLARPEARVV